MSSFAHILDIYPGAWAVIPCKSKCFALDIFGFTVHSSSPLVEIPPEKWEIKPNHSFSPPPPKKKSCWNTNISHGRGRQWRNKWHFILQHCRTVCTVGLAFGCRGIQWQNSVSSCPLPYTEAKNLFSCSGNSNFLSFLKQLNKDNLPFWNEPPWGLGSGSPPNMMLQESVALPDEQKEHKSVISPYITKCMKMLYTVKYLPSH